MTTPTPTPTSAVGPGRATFAHVVRSEWTKLRSVRSTFWSLLSLFVVTVGFSVLFCWGVAASYNQMEASDRASLDATSLSLGGLMFGQLAIAVLGVMIISAEYSTGGIRNTFVAVPRRVTVLVAKALVFAVVALVVSMVTAFVSFFIGQLFLSSQNLEVSLGDPDVLRGVIGGGLYLMASGLFGFALGALFRNTAGGITMAVAGLIVLPMLTLALPGAWGDTIERFFTSNAGQQITVVHQTSDNALGPWAGYLVFTVWWVALLALAAVFMTKRDA